MNIPTPEALKALNGVYDPDPRNLHFEYFDPNTQCYHPYRLDKFHKEISKIELQDCVPEDIRIFFETAKNLYLYSWFVYRFFNVSEHQALCCLEYALREKYGEAVQEKIARKPTLYPLLKHAIEKNHIENSDFAVWQCRVQMAAENRHQIELIRRMQQENLDEIIIDESSITVTEEDMKYDYLSVLQETLPKIRNTYAHGSSMLFSQSLHTFDIVSTIINRIYQADS